MKTCFLLIVLMFLMTTIGCSRAPSSQITKNTLSDIVSINDTITKLERNVTSECKTPVFMSNLESVKKQVNSVSGQIKSIDLACEAEKEVISQQKTNREIIIGVLLMIILFIFYLFFKKRFLGVFR